jgi:hypothetical protein
MSASQHAAQVNAGDLLIGFAIISATCVSIAGLWRRIVTALRAAGELRHQRRVELERIRSGSGPPLFDARGHHLRYALPAAGIPAPPGARAPAGVPGPCQHEAIVPVIAGDGELQEWICRNFERCDARFHKSVAVYAPDAAGPAR